MTADHALDHTLEGQVVESAFVSIPDPERMHYREIARRSGRLESLLQGSQQGIWLDQSPATADNPDAATVGD